MCHSCGSFLDPLLCCLQAGSIFHSCPSIPDWKPLSLSPDSPSKVHIIYSCQVDLSLCCCSWLDGVQPLIYPVRPHSTCLAWFSILPDTHLLLPLSQSLHYFLYIPESFHCTFLGPTDFPRMFFFSSLNQIPPFLPRPHHAFSPTEPSQSVPDPRHQLFSKPVSFKVCLVKYSTWCSCFHLIV